MTELELQARKKGYVTNQIYQLSLKGITASTEMVQAMYDAIPASGLPEWTKLDEAKAKYEEVKPYEPNNNKITYTASEKLSETTTPGMAGLHTNAFNTTITSHTFSNGTGTIIFADDVTSIGNNAFYNCSSLTSVTIVIKQVGLNI